MACNVAQRFLHQLKFFGEQLGRDVALLGQLGGDGEGAF